MLQNKQKADGKKGSLVSGKAQKANDRDVYAQFAALCYRKAESGHEILLITSRDTGRWVIPKGWGIKGLSAPEVAAREAYEEAGIIGKVGSQSVGAYHYEKLIEDAPSKFCRVEVYPLRVTDRARKFPEKGEREYRWFSPKKAARRVDEPELRDLIATFRPH